MAVEVWKEPESRSAYVMGVDTAEGLKHGDYSCIQVLNIGTGEQVAYRVEDEGARIKTSRCSI